MRTKLVVCIEDLSRYIDPDVPGYEIPSPKRGEICTVEGECYDNEFWYYYLAEYPQLDPNGERDCYWQDKFVEILQPEVDAVIEELVSIPVNTEI